MSNTRRLFFAAIPPDPVISDIVDNLQPQLGHKIRLTRRENLHITLCFLGHCSDETKACAEKVADNIQASEFDFTLDEIKWWKRPRIYCLESKQVPEPMKQLVKQLDNKLRVTCDLKLEERVYRPHITLARKASTTLSAVEFQPLRWRITSFHLMESVSTEKGVRYNSLNKWDLLSCGASGDKSTMG